MNRYLLKLVGKDPYYVSANYVNIEQGSLVFAHDSIDRAYAPGVWEWVQKSCSNNETGHGL